MPRVTSTQRQIDDAPGEFEEMLFWILEAISAQQIHVLALLGAKPEQAYFVRCDRTTMTQNDLDNGRMICLVGVAPTRPAEFVIFRVGQWTADSKD